MARRLSTLLIVVGALVLVEGLLTLVWQEPASGLYAGVQQDRLDGVLAATERRTPRPVARRRLAATARAAARRAAPGEPLARLEVPAIGLRTVVVEGTGAAELRSGPGHMEGTALPGLTGTVAIAGHRTTYGAPFRHVDELEAGDPIVLRMPYGRFTYRVQRTRILAADATWVTRRAGYDRLVLTACHPLYSAKRRIVVFARLEAA